MIAVELTPPEKDLELSPLDNFELREFYINKMVEALKLKYQRAIENNEWEIILVVESRIQFSNVLIEAIGLN